MKEIDQGHAYELDRYDGDGAEHLTFMKREGVGYPGNVGHYPGTNCQEVLRALIARAKYLNGQIPCEETTEAISHLRHALHLFERRAARRHGRVLYIPIEGIAEAATCKICGHIDCGQDHG